MNSYSDPGHVLHTPHESLSGESLPVEGRLGPDCSRRSSDLLESNYVEGMDPYVAHQVEIHGIEWFDGASSSQDSRSIGHTFLNEDDGAVWSIDEAIYMRTWYSNNECKPFNKKPIVDLHRR